MRELRLRMSRSGFAALGVEELLSVIDEFDSVRFRSLACRGCSGTVIIEVDEPMETARVESLEYVDSFDLVGRGPDRFEYLLRVDLPRCQEALTETEGEFYVDGPLHLDEEGLTFTAVASQQALTHFGTACCDGEDFSTHFEVLSIRDYSGRNGRVDTLTDRQREVLTTAYERDYFDVPRGVTTEELAIEFGLDKSTVLEHLRRAEHNLLERTFERGQVPRP